MNPLTFSFALDNPSNNGHMLLSPMPDSIVISEETWYRMAAEIQSEKTLIHYPSSVLETRWQRGHAAITLYEDRIVSYICLAPIYSADNRHKFAACLNIDPETLPAIDVYEFTTAWTAPEWRRYGISGQMRPPMLARFFHAAALGASGMAGLASPVLAKLGWQIIGWGRLPFTSSLTAIPIQGFEPESERGWRPPSHLRRYEAEHIPLEDQTHPWKEFAYFWVSDVALAETVNAQFEEAVEHDLCRWRRAIIEVFRAPEEVHRLAFLD
jgi:hypothetical protein